MDVLDEISVPARRLYRAMCDVAASGICKANQRELMAILSVGHVSIMEARDELVKSGLVERIHHKPGRRDWYKIRAATEVQNAREAAKRVAERSARSSKAFEKATAQLSLALPET